MGVKKSIFISLNSVLGKLFSSNVTYLYYIRTYIVILLEKTKNELKLRNYSQKTSKSYLYYLSNLLKTSIITKLQTMI